jgi:hypothetical protein
VTATPPVNLAEDQKQQFQQDVEEALEAFGVTTQALSNPLLNSLSPRQVQALYKRFLVWSEKGARLVGAQADKLRTIRQLRCEQLQIQRSLDDAEITTDEARQKFNILSCGSKRFQMRGTMPRQAELASLSWSKSRVLGKMPPKTTTTPCVCYSRFDISKTCLLTIKSTFRPYNVMQGVALNA